MTKYIAADVNIKYMADTDVCVWTEICFCGHSFRQYVVQGIKLFVTLTHPYYGGQHLTKSCLWAGQIQLRSSQQPHPSLHFCFVLVWTFFKFYSWTSTGFNPSQLLEFVCFWITPRVTWLPPTEPALIPKSERKRKIYMYVCELN